MLRPKPASPRDLDGLPVAHPLETRVSKLVLLVATLWFALAAAWELFGPLLAGHYASSASVGIIADNMLKWGIAGPVWEYSPNKPGPGSYYCHHPWGIFWATTLAMKVLGRYDYVCRIVPVVLSAATPPLLYALGRSIWRPAAGAAAAAAFVVLPITLAFANFNALEVPVIAWSLLGVWGYVRLTQSGRLRYLVASLTGMTIALHCDWPAYVLAASLLGFALVRGVLLRPVFGPVANERRQAQWWALSATIAVATAALYLVLFQKSGKLDDLFGSAGLRSAGNSIPLAKVLESRRYWIELSFTPIAIVLGKASAVIAALRLVWLRREHEVVPLALLAMASVQYVVFKQGADIHVFWPHYFAAYFALAMGGLTATVAGLGEWAFRRRARQTASPGASVALASLGFALLPLAAIARDGIPALVYARGTGGRFNEKGLLIHSDGSKTAFLRFVARDLPMRAAVAMHEGMKTTWSQVWTLGGRLVAQARPVPKTQGEGDARVYLADTRFLLDGSQADLANRFHVTAVGPFWSVALGEAAAPIDAYSIVEREPAAWEWYLVSGTEPHREIVPDPYRTWELRAHFGQPAEVPKDAPRTLQDKRIAHNIAVAAGDAGRATALRAELEGALVPVHEAFDDGSQLVGTTFTDGARSLLTLYVLAGEPPARDVQLTVKSRVTAKARWSSTMADPTEREVGLPLSIAPQRWKKGFLYADAVPIRKRPGTEGFRASYWTRGKGPAPKPLRGGAAGVEVLTLR